MNIQIFHAINNLAGQSQFWDAVGIFLADKLLYLFLGILVAVWLRKRFRPYVYLAAGSALISRLVIVEAIKRLMDRPRPYEVMDNIHQLLVDNEKGMSFPSGHAVIYFSLAMAFWGTEYFWPFIILATLGSLARVFVGVHFPGDILASFFIAFVVVWILRRLFKNRILS